MVLALQTSEKIPLTNHLSVNLQPKSGGAEHSKMSASFLMRAAAAADFSQMLVEIAEARWLFWHLFHNKFVESSLASPWPVFKFPRPRVYAEK